MSKPLGSNGRSQFARMLLLAQYHAYLRVAARKHGISTEGLGIDVQKLTDEELAQTVSSLRDLAHLPPE